MLMLLRGLWLIHNVGLALKLLLLLLLLLLLEERELLGDGGG